MPFGDRTGPAGMGPMTGRGAGFCAGYGVPGYANRGLAGGFPGHGGGWSGRGGGRGHRNWYRATGLMGWQRAAMGLPYAQGFPGPVAPFPPAAFQPLVAQPSAEQELELLKNQVKYMEDGLKQAQDRIRELEQEKQAE